MVQEQINDAKSRMHKAVEALKAELATVRGGRASTGLVDHLKVDYYGTPTALNQIATITTPDAKLIVITPYDRDGSAETDRRTDQRDRQDRRGKRKGAPGRLAGRPEPLTAQDVLYY